MALSAKGPLQSYLDTVAKALQVGNATEHTHRPSLKTLLEDLDDKITVTNEPQKIACGAPDLIIHKKNIPLGHIETKDIGTSLENIEKDSERQIPKTKDGEQLKRYRAGLPNLILTDYLEFRWYVNGEKRLIARLANHVSKKKLAKISGGVENVNQLIQSFLKLPAITVDNAKDLAERLAGITRIIHDLILKTFEKETEKGWLHNWLKGFQEVLIPDLASDEFADMFAQTIAYGLFAARVHVPTETTFSRELASHQLPKTNPFLRKLFHEIAGVEMPDTITWAVDDIVELLQRTDLAKVLKDFGAGKGKGDPVVHFYETFLAAYDPGMRALRGVYYTPEPVVSYIVRSIDHLLKIRFGRPKGLADKNTLILDPAVGTATFLYAIVSLIYESMGKQKGAWDGYVAKHLLNRLFGFEILMAPYAVAHLKLGLELKQTGYTFGSNQRLGIYLTNTLEEAAKKTEKLFAQWISEEANAAVKIKRDLPIMVVTGNPPYSSSVFEGNWIMQLVEDYKKGLTEKKLDLNREEWKFLRFAQWRIERTGSGILAFVINNSFLDAITHRRMRQCLMECFTDIYILDLHGSVLSKKKAPGGKTDQNVFDIEQGVTVAIFIREDQKPGASTVHHAELWGTAEEKYDYLINHSLADTKWEKIKPEKDEYFFTPINLNLREEYQKGWKVTEIFTKYSSGIQTKKDQLSIQFDRDKILDIVKDFSKRSIESAREHYDLGKDSSGWSVEDARKDIKDTGIDEKRVQAILYRPFDIRYTYYTGNTGGFHGRPRREIMQHMLAGPNVGLIAMRQTVGESYNHVGVTNLMNCHGTFYLGNRGQDYLFPLYLYPDTQGDEAQTDWVTGGDAGIGKKVANFSPAFIKAINQLRLTLVVDRAGDFKKTIGAEDVLGYIYAILQSPTYRVRYASLLRTDFPHIPLTRDMKLFAKLSYKGRELMALHLMTSPKLEDLITEFPEKGDNVVDKVEYHEDDKQVWINDKQYFAGITKQVWQFEIGGYQVCEKWLAYRRGRALTWDDLQHYQKIVVVIDETLRLFGQVDNIISEWPLPSLAMPPKPVQVQDV